MGSLELELTVVSCEMFGVIRGRGLVRGVRLCPLSGKRGFRPSRPANCEDTVWPWKWWEKPLPTQETEKKIEWTPVLVITNISFHTGFRRAATKISWWRTECDG